MRLALSNYERNRPTRLETWKTTRKNTQESAVLPWSRIFESLGKFPQTAYFTQCISNIPELKVGMAVCEVSEILLDLLLWWIQSRR